MPALTKQATVAVIGAGTMGAGIAQVAAQAGHAALLFDTRSGAATQAILQIECGLRKRVAAGKLDESDLRAILGRLRATEDFDQLRSATLFIEAVSEDLEVKRSLFAKIEAFGNPDAILATNTSTLSVTAMAAKLAHPERVVGMHFFNPPTVMRLVEVISGLATDPELVETIDQTAKAWGKIAARTRSTPGFIVNRVARPYYGEALRLLEEGFADAATIDAIMTESGGFRMGPFALMDLIGNDINFKSTLSVFEGYAGEPRFRPSPLQKEMVDAGWLGRKSGRGFYRYDHESKLAGRTERLSSGKPSQLPTGWHTTTTQIGDVVFVPVDGRRAVDIARERKQPCAVHDLRLNVECPRVAIALSPMSPVQISDVIASVQQAGFSVTVVPDWPGLVVMRTVAMLVNEAFFATLQNVADETAVDHAMRQGVNYPKGPAEWARELGLARIVAVLDALFETTRDSRYRVAQNLRFETTELAVAP